MNAATAVCADSGSDVVWQGTVKGNKTAKQENLVGLPNPKIRGWANYHNGSVAKKTFAKVDHEIWKTLWQWAKRRHPDKGTQWVMDRYFRTEGNRKWVFAASIKTREGEPTVARLVNASGTSKSEAKPTPSTPDRKATLKTG